MPSSSWLVVHHVTVVDEAPGEIEKAAAEGYAPVPRHHHGVAPIPLCERLAVDSDHLEGIGVDVKDVVVLVLVDDGPLFDRAKLDALIDAMRIESPATNEKADSW